MREVNFLRAAVDKAPQLDVNVKDDFEAGKGPRLIVCRFCGHRITSSDHRISVHGSHGHTFFNPQGIVFELGCFAKAQGCLIHGMATTEFTWFNGFAWSFASCRGCSEHLGWYYDAGGNGFYGLIVSKLQEKG